MNRIDDQTIIEEGINKAAQHGDPFLGFIPSITYEDYNRCSYQEKKKKIINHLMETGVPAEKQFGTLIEDLEKFEKLLYATNKFYRDHVFHTFRVWGLGLYIYHKGLKASIDKDEKSYFHFKWYLAATYHDVGYPISALNKINEDLNSYFEYLGIDKLVDFQEVINPALNEKRLNTKLENLFPEDAQEINYNVMAQKHGYMGARLLLKSLIDRFEGTEYSEHADTSLVAIGKHDRKKPISYKDEPISALLVICDELQEWGRPYISPLLGEKYVSTDHIQLEIDPNGNIPRLTASIDYRKSQNDLKNILGWEPERTEKDKIDNLDRVKEINIEVEMVYEK